MRWPRWQQTVLRGLVCFGTGVLIGVVLGYEWDFAVTVSLVLAVFSVAIMALAGAQAEEALNPVAGPADGRRTDRGNPGGRPWTTLGQSTGSGSRCDAGAATYSAADRRRRAGHLVRSFRSGSRDLSRRGEPS
jgi:hypothetical protein